MARKFFARALEAQPAYESALQSWGRLEAELGELDTARSLFERALQLQPDNTFVLTVRAAHAARAGPAGACAKPGRLLAGGCCGHGGICRR